MAMLGEIVFRFTVGYHRLASYPSFRHIICVDVSVEIPGYQFSIVFLVFCVSVVCTCGFWCGCVMLWLVRWVRLSICCISHLSVRRVSKYSLLCLESNLNKSMSNASLQCIMMNLNKRSTHDYTF
jgi:hypothetical protein